MRTKKNAPKGGLKFLRRWGSFSHYITKPLEHTRGFVYYYIITVNGRAIVTLSFLFVKLVSAIIQKVTPKSDYLWKATSTPACLIPLYQILNLYINKKMTIWFTIYSFFYGYTFFNLMTTKNSPYRLFFQPICDFVTYVSLVYHFFNFCQEKTPLTGTGFP